MEQKFQVGIIASTHGIRGEVKVFPTTDDVKRYQQLKKVYLDTGKEHLLLEIEQVKYFKKFAILKFKGIDNINDIEKYKGKSLLIDRTDAVPLEAGEYYIADMIGMEVYLEDGSLFGRLSEVMETGANDVYVIQSKEHGEVLLPAIRQCVSEVDTDNGRLTVRLMEGLL